MKAEPFLDLCKATSDAVSSLRCCQPDERPAEAKRVREWVAELKGAKLLRANPKLEAKRATVLELAEWVLGDLG